MLIFLLLIRCVLGWLTTWRFDTGRSLTVSGDIVNIYHKNSECIMTVGNFLINSGDICAGKVGDRIRAFGSLERGLIDSFQGRLWLVSKQIERLPKTQKIKNSKPKNGEWVNNFRESLVLNFKKNMPEPEAGLVSGIVLGYKNDIGQEFYNQMIKSGSIHIAVASGYNILLVGGVILSWCFWFWKRSRAIWIALVAMIGYGALAGGDPPVIRAIWMAGMMYLGQAMGRGGVSWWILTLTAWVMLMIDPSLMASASFQLSVAASFGLVAIEPWVSVKLAKILGSGLAEVTTKSGLLTTLSTMIMTLPILWWHFGRMSLIGIVSNILILPFVPPIMILGTAMLVLPGLFAWPTYAVAHWVVLIIQFFGT